MGCCDSKERKGQDSKFYDSNTYDEDSTKMEQDDFKIAILKKNFQRDEKDKSSAKNVNQLPYQRQKSKNEQEIKKEENPMYDVSRDILANEACQGESNNNNNNIQQDDEERKSQYSLYYTPPNDPSEIPHSFQEDSFMLDLQLSNQQKPYFEYDLKNRKSEMRPNFEEQSDQLIRSGSVPIYLKNSKAFIIPGNGKNFDMKSFLEETKQALETLQQNQEKNINIQEQQQLEQEKFEEDEDQVVDDECFSSPKNLFDAEFDKEINQPFGNIRSESQKVQKIDHFYELDVIKNQISSAKLMQNIDPQTRWDQINIEEELNEKEQKIFQHFKQIFLEDMEYPNKSEISDHYLVRFLRSKKFDLKYTKKFLEEHFEWRVREKIDSIFVRNIKLRSIQKISNLKRVMTLRNTILMDCIILITRQYMLTEQMRDQCKQYIWNDLNQGRPLYIERLGQLNISKLFEVTTQERLEKYYIQFYEKMIKHIFQLCTQMKGKRIDKMVVIIDCKDISLRIDQISSFLKTAVNITKENYPEILHKMYIVNTGMMFNIAWKAVSVLLGEKTKKKISILGTKFHHELEKDIPKENIPKFLGGQCKCEGDNCMNNNCGP